LDQKESQFDVLKKKLANISVAYQNAAKDGKLVDVGKVAEHVAKPDEQNEKFTSEEL
jgi:hypothetical protein